jgi:hypothetical protein
VRKVGLLVLVLAALSLGAASGSQADRRELPCGLPDQGQDGTLWIDFGWPGLADVFAKPGVIIAASSGDFPAQMRTRGAATVHWDMNLRNRVGIPNAPADPATIVDRANKLFDYAVQQSGCTTPLIAENELFGAGLVTPWSDTNEQYRANVMTYLRTLSERGARPFLLINSPPYTGGDAADWWREVSKYADLVREIYPGAKGLYKLGPVVGNRFLRTTMRQSLADFTEIGIPTSRLGVMLGFQTGKGGGGRVGLQPSAAWFRVAKWQALSAQAIARETNLASVWSWGWGEWTPPEQDPDKPAAACVWLWARSPSLCNGPEAAGTDFVASRTEGQIVLPSGAQCRVGDRGLLMTRDILALQTLTGDRELAYAGLLARIAETPYAKVTAKDVRQAERAVIAEHFNGSAAAYRAALADAGANTTIARGVLADALRHLRLERTLHVAPASGAAVATFYRSYPELVARPVIVKPTPSWLGWRTRGWAFDSIAPPRVFTLGVGTKSVVRSVEGSFVVRATGPGRPLATLPLASLVPSIRSVLDVFARRVAFDSWTTTRQTEALRLTICRRDDLPVASAVELTDYLPFLSTTG